MPPYQEDSPDLSTASGEAFDPPRLSVWELISRGAEHHPHRPAAICVHQPRNHLAELVGDPDNSAPDGAGAKYLSWSYSTLQRTAERVADALSARGIEPGDTIAMFAMNCVEWMLLYWAAARLGAVWAPMDRRFVERPDELEYYVRATNAKMVVVKDQTAAQNAVVARSPALEKASIKLVCQASADEVPQQWHSLVGLVDEYETRGMSKATTPRVSELPRDDEPASILFTSGTTMYPKGAVRSVRAQIAQGIIFAEMMHFTSSSCIPIQSASFRAICNIDVLAMWPVGGKCVFPSEDYHPAVLAPVMKDLGATHLLAVPSYIYQLAEQKGIVQSMDTMEHLIVGGEIVTETHLRDGLAVFNAKACVPMYGTTEGATFLSVQPGDRIRTTAGGIVNAGYPTPGCRIKVCDPDAREPVPRGRPGELHVSSPCLASGYLDDRDGKAFYVEDGRRYWVSGDQGVMDSEGGIFLLGRYKEIVKVNAGVGLSPAVLETSLNKLPGVMAVTMGTPHKTRGSTAVAILKSDVDDATKEEMRKALIRDVGFEAELGGIMTLEELGFEDYPRNAMNKVMRHEMASAVAKRMQELGNDV